MHRNNNVTLNNSINRTSAAVLMLKQFARNIAITILHIHYRCDRSLSFRIPAGVTGLWASNVITISGIPTVSGLFT